MNEISRCCQLLGVKHGITSVELRKTYRDLVQVWHPDRFAGNDRLQAKAQEQLTEINLAYEYLIAHAIVDEILVEPPDDPAADFTSPPPQEPPAPGPATESAPSSPAASASKSKVWVLAVLALIAALACFLAVRAKHHPATYFTELLPQMSAENTGGYFQTAQLLTPPFALKLKFKLKDRTELRVRYEFGHLTFNAPDNPTDLFIRAPRSFAYERLTGLGGLLPDVTHELIWKLTTTNQLLTVDGEVRYQAAGYFDNIKGYAGINPHEDGIELASFAVETPQPLPPPETKPHVATPDDLLSIMIPEHNLRVTHSDEGTVLSLPGARENGLMTPQHYSPPFTIRTRAKVDAYNLRLFCGTGQLNFNWNGDPYRLRLENFMNAKSANIPGKGMVTPNEWHLFKWDIEKTGFKLYIDGELRLERKMDLANFNGSVGIGTAEGRVTVDYFLVE